MSSVAFDPSISIYIFDDSGAGSSVEQQKAGADNYIYLTKLRVWKLLEMVQTQPWMTDINFQLD